MSTLKFASDDALRRDGSHEAREILADRQDFAAECARQEKAERLPRPCTECANCGTQLACRRGYWLCPSGCTPDERPLHVHEAATCGNCERSWCHRCDPGPAALCHFCHGRGSSPHEMAECVACGNLAIDEDRATEACCRRAGALEGESRS